MIDFLKKTGKKVFRFGITGGLGTITNLVLFFIFADKLNFPDILVNVCCFFIAASQNYIINHLWTFREQTSTGLSVKLWGKFILSSLAGYICNLIVYLIISRAFTWQFKVIPQAIGILCGMCINFIFSNFFVFKKTNDEKTSLE